MRWRSSTTPLATQQISWSELCVPLAHLRVPPAPRRPPCYPAAVRRRDRPAPLTASAPVSPGGPGRRGPAGSCYQTVLPSPWGTGRGSSRTTGTESVRLGEALSGPGVRRGDEVEGRISCAPRSSPRRWRTAGCSHVVGLRVGVVWRRGFIAVPGVVLRCGNSPTRARAPGLGQPCQWAVRQPTPGVRLAAPGCYRRGHALHLPPGRVARRGRPGALPALRARRHPVRARPRGQPEHAPDSSSSGGCSWASCTSSASTT